MMLLGRQDGESEGRRAARVRWRAVRWFVVPFAVGVALAGYFGPWVDHAAAGLVITGLDLGEVVKFLPEFQRGELRVWREGFYLPLVCASLVLALNAYRAELRTPRMVRPLLLLLSGVAALNLLPPAWTPALLFGEEFRLQAAMMFFCLGVVVLSPFGAALPGGFVRFAGTGLVIGSLWFAVGGFVGMVPAISAVYGRPVEVGWGVWLYVVGMVSLVMGMWAVGSGRQGVGAEEIYAAGGDE